MRKICITICLIANFINCYAQKKTDWQEYQLKGRVKSLTITEYNATEKFGEPVKTGIKDKTETIIIQFDTKGMIIPPTKSDNIVNKYDTKGNKIEETTYDSDKSSIESKSVFKYDAYGNVIEEVNYNSEGELTEKKVNTYDLKGNLLQCKKSGKLFNGTRNQGQPLITKFKYDANSRPIETNVYIGESELASVHSKYDGNGNLIENYTSAVNGRSIKETFRYTLDSKGNWTSKILYSSGSYMDMSDRHEASQITERIIEYYKDASQIEKEYKELILKADSNVVMKNYSQAIDYYLLSLETKNDLLIKERIDNIKKLQTDEKYQKTIYEADLAFNEKKYNTALMEYQKALEIKDEQYPKDKIIESQTKIDEEKRRKEEEERKIAEEKEKIKKFNAALNRGYSFFESKKYKEALIEYNSASAIEASQVVLENIKITEKEIHRIDSLQKLRLEIYSYIKTHYETISTEMTSLKVSLEDRKKIYGTNYELCMNSLNFKFQGYFSSINTLFAINNTTGLQVEETWNEKDQEAMDQLIKFKEEFKTYEKFHSAVKTAFETVNKDQLKLLKSSDDPKEIISKF